MGNPGEPDPQRHSEQHPGDRNYPAQPAGEQSGYRPTMPLPADPSPTSQTGYQLGYSPGAYTGAYAGPQPGYAAPPPQGPPHGGSGGAGGPGGGGNRKALWFAAAAVAVVAILAVIVVLVATGGDDTSTASSTTTTTPERTTTRTTTAPTTGGGFALPSGLPSISLPPILGGGSTTGPNAREWKVEVTGTGTAQLAAVGVPDTGVFATQTLPFSKSFTSDAGLVAVTVLGYTGDVECTISRNGTVVAQNSSAGESGGGPVICTGTR